MKDNKNVQALALDNLEQVSGGTGALFDATQIKVQHSGKDIFIEPDGPVHKPGTVQDLEFHSAVPAESGCKPVAQEVPTLKLHSD